MLQVLNFHSNDAEEELICMNNCITNSVLSEKIKSALMDNMTLINPENIKLIHHMMLCVRKCVYMCVWTEGGLVADR